MRILTLRDWRLIKYLKRLNFHKNDLFKGFRRLICRAVLYFIVDFRARIWFKGFCVNGGRWFAMVPLRNAKEACLGVGDLVLGIPIRRLLYK